MNTPYPKISAAMLAILLLSACRDVKDEGAVYDEEGMDPGVRQIVMEEEYEEPQQEEGGLIAAPSDFIRMD
jgi:hypothetical protein